MVANGKLGEKIFGGEVFRVVFVEEDHTEITEQLGPRGAFGVLENDIDGDAGFFWPMSSHGVGDVDEGFGAILFVRCEAFGNPWRRLVGFPGQPSGIASDGIQPGEKFGGLSFGGFAIKTADRIRWLSSPEIYGNAAGSQRSKQRLVGSEGLGSEQAVFSGAEDVAASLLRASVEDRNQRLAL